MKRWFFSSPSSPSSSPSSSAAPGPQAKSPEGASLAKTVLLPMAERMIDKLVKEDKLADSGAVELFLMILELQEKYDDALLVLKGQSVSQSVSHPRQVMIREQVCHPRQVSVSR